MYTSKRTNLQFKIKLEEAPVPIASAQQYHIYILFKHVLYTLLRESSRKMYAKTQ